MKKPFFIKMITSLPLGKDECVNESQYSSNAERSVRGTRCSMMITKSSRSVAIEIPRSVRTETSCVCGCVAAWCVVPAP